MNELGMRRLAEWIRPFSCRERLFLIMISRLLSTRYDRWLDSLASFHFCFHHWRRKIIFTSSLRADEIEAGHMDGWERLLQHDNVVYRYLGKCKWKMSSLLLPVTVKLNFEY